MDRTKDREYPDAIFLRDDARRSFLPRVPCDSDPEWIKHVYCDGSREHVKRYGGYVDLFGNMVGIERCSEPKCIINKHAAEIEATLDDVKASAERSRQARERRFCRPPAGEAW